MKKTITNPYLPGWEYVPDGEPHVFGERIYVFGSHDQAAGTAYCQQDYVAWSAPVDDLSDWRCEGVIYRKDQDPHNKIEMKELWAPDVCQGVDGRYYLYYCRAFVPEIGIAVSDRPSGPYEFYDYVRDEKGEIWNHDLPFDPGVLYEDEEHIWLYSGFGADPVPGEITIEMLRMQEPFQELPLEALEGMMQQLEIVKHPSKNCSCLRLEADMKTVKAVTPVAPAKGYAAGTSFEQHPFFEASSIRKIKEMYYLVYSSYQGNELCYATSRYPDKEFEFGGVIISNGDLGYNGNTKARAYHANNHGGIVEINGQWYVFYHRHTNNSQFSRQGCAELIQILSDGTIPQVEITSSGLNGKALPASQTYSAHICCNLLGPDGAGYIDVQNGMPENTPFITEEGTGTDHINQYVHNLRQGAVCGVKYIEFGGEASVSLVLRGKGILNVILDDEEQEAVCSIDVDCDKWTNYKKEIHGLSGIHAVYFKIENTDSYIDFSEFQFQD